MADVMNEFSSSNGEVDDGNVSIKLNGDACDDASSITANSSSLQVDNDQHDSISSKDKLSSSNIKKLDCTNDADGGLNSKLHEQHNSLKSSAVANGRMKSSSEDDENSSNQNDNCDEAQCPPSAVAKKLVCEATSETNERVIDGAGDNCDSDKAESSRQSNSKSNDIDRRTDHVADLSVSKEGSSSSNSIVNSQSSSCSISIVEENGAKSDGDIVATDLSKRSSDSSSDAERKMNANGADEDDEANEDDEVISISSTPDKSKKSSKKPSMSIVNITPRRSSRNLNKQQKCYTEKDGEFENSCSDGVSIIATKKRVAGSSGDDEIEEITPTDPLAEEPNRPSPSAGAKMRNKTIVVSDTKGLVEFASNTKASRSNKKEPTLVIIDTNSILSGRGPIPVSQHAGSNSLLHSSSSSTPIPVSLPIPAGAFANATRGSMPSSSAFSVIPIGLPAQGMYSQCKNPPPAIKPIVVGAPSTSVTPVSHPSTVSTTLSATTITTVASTQPTNKQPPVILPSLTDDMFVVEAPSFIVPYVYEKPPMKSLKEHIEKIETDIKAAAAEEAQLREQQELAEVKQNTDKTTQSDDEEKSTLSNDKNDKETADTSKEDSSCDHSKQSDKGDEQMDESLTKEQDKSTDKNDTAKKDESEPMEVDGENQEVAGAALSTKPSAAIIEPETITNNIVKKIEIDSPVNAVKEIEKKITAGPTTGTDDPKKPASYFDNPLGKFFMQIGLNLVQEHVQTDLLRSQKRKRDKEGNKCSQDVHSAIDELTKTLESSKENNDPFKLELKKCELCSFKTESLLVMAHHLETPHMKNYTYRCNFCTLEVRSPHDILFHMEAEHNIRGRLERAPAFHQCPNCPFEDNQKGKLTRHLISCSKKYRPERNQEPPLDWEPPAKIPRVTRNRPPSMSPGNAVYQAAMSGLKQMPQNTLLPKLMPSTTNMKHNMLNVANKRPNVANAFLNRFPNAAATQPNFQQRPPISMPASNQSMMFRAGAGTNSQTPVLLPQGYHLSGAQIYQTQNKNSQSTQQNLAAAKLLNQPSISITPLPRQSTSNNSSSNAKSGTAKSMNVVAGGNKNPGGNFVVCEICDGYIKDLEQLRNHMQWIHKVKIHPKMIYNRPPLNCQKCQERFFTDQGLERHLLGAHGLVTSSMQEAANKGKDGGRCPVCGRVYQWKLLNHVARDHQMALKPAHLSYKCTVCTATFGMYKQFESHVYSAHSVVAKRAMDTSKKPPSGPSSSQNDTLLKPLKINDEITIIPQPVRSSRPPNKESNAATITKTVTSSKKMNCENDNSSNKRDELHEQADADTDDRLCKRVCSKEDFADDEAFQKHIRERHLQSFKIVLSRLNLKLFDRIPNKENAFKLTKFDQNVISDDVRNTYRLGDFFIEIKRLKLRDDCKYKVLVNDERSGQKTVWDDMHLVPEAVYSVESEFGDKNATKARGAVTLLNTLYEKRKVESLLAIPPPSRSKSATKETPNRIMVGSSTAAAAYCFNGGKQKRLMSRGRRNAARQNARKRSVDSSELDSSSSSDEYVPCEERRPPLSYQNAASTCDSLDDHFMSGLARFPQLAKRDNTYTFTSTSCSMLSRRTITTATRKTTNGAPPLRQFPSRGKSSSNPFTIVNQRSVTTSQSRATFGAVRVGPASLSKTASATNAFNAQLCRQSSVKVTQRVTTYHAQPQPRKQQLPASRPTPQKVVNKPAPQAVISLLSDSDESAVEIVESEPPALPNTEDNDVYILPT